MVTRTSLLAIRTLIFLAQREPATIFPLKGIAEGLGESPTYLAKVARLLVKAGILRAAKGVKGGVQLSRPPAQITLLAIIEACQGVLVGSYCQGEFPLEATCAYHQAAVALRKAIEEVLSSFSLAQLAKKPRPTRPLPGGLRCVLEESGRARQGAHLGRSLRVPRR
jgi:Rrf2 family protein